MYYDKGMKRTVFALGACLLGVWAGAQSTCEVRVDAHPRATTKQRVDYCLTGSSETESNNPGLVFSGVTSRHAEESIVEKPSARAGYFNQENIKVERSLVSTRQFPQFTNGTLSEQEMRATRRVAIEPFNYTTQQPYRTVERQERSLSTVVETRAGLQTRQAKPWRKLRIVEKEQPSPVTDLSEVTSKEEVAPVAAEYTYDSANTQSYIPSAPQAQEYAPVEQAAQPYAPETVAPQEEILEGTSAYAPVHTGE